MHSCW